MSSSEFGYTYEPRLLRHAEVERYIWGDDESGHVIDWYYRNSDKLIVSMFSLAPGAKWTHSEMHKSFYDADEGYYILQGSLTFHNPISGEVYVVDQGETLHFRGHTWHYGYNFGREQVLIVAGFAPLPADLTDAEELGRAATPLASPKGIREELLGEWPWNSEEAQRTRTIRHMTHRDWLHSIQGTESPIRVSLFLSTERLTMGMITIPPGITSDVEAHPGDEVVFAASGSGNVFLPESRQIFDMHRLDATYIPENVPHRYINDSGETITLIFGVAPAYQ